jgi:hypothetical protein
VEVADRFALLDENSRVLALPQRSKFLAREVLTSAAALRQGSLKFGALHNARYRYSKLGGKTPMQSLAATEHAIGS